MREFIRESSTKHTKLDIPTKYSFSDEVKLLYEIPRFDGSRVKFYENFMIELKQKHNLVHKFYPDGSIISIFPNRDIRLVSNSADAFYKFRILLNHFLRIKYMPFTMS